MKKISSDTRCTKRQAATMQEETSELSEIKADETSLITVSSYL